jgi:hypothetical protein
VQSEISSLSTVILALEKARIHKEPNLECRGLTDLVDAMFCHKTLHES